MDFKLRDKSEITSTCWIEFNISGTADAYNHWAASSRYLDESAYNLFTDILEKHADHFNYYGPTWYTPAQLCQIKKDIEERAMALDQLNNLDELVTFSSKTAYALDLTADLKHSYAQHNDHLDKVVADIKRLATSLTDLLDRCIADNKMLCVIGL